MTVAELIAQYLRRLPESVQAEVLDFIRGLEGTGTAGEADQGSEWSAYSLSSAMRGMGDEPNLYSLDDLREVF